VASPIDSVAVRWRPVADWLGRLTSTDPAVRREAVEALSDASTGLADLLRRLGGAVGTPAEPADRAALIAALGRAGAQTQSAVAAVHAYVKAAVLTDPTEAVRSAGLNALAVLGPRAKTEVPALVAALKDELADVRAEAARTLGGLGPDARDAIPALIPVTEYDPNPRVRVEAAAALWRIDHHPGKVVPTCVAALASVDEVVRWVAADCLGEIGPDARAAVPALSAAYAMPARAGLVRVGIRLALERIDPAAAVGLG
jgi:HEAT repeat protein